MYRLFETARTRERRSLDGHWEFVTDPEQAGEDRFLDDFPTDPDHISVPCAWNALSEYHDYRGDAWYRCEFTVPESGAVRLIFHGVAHDATVYLDGEQRADHYGGYTPFEIVEPELTAGEHELLVRVDNRRTDTTIPLPNTDWFEYGGITREVALERVPDAFVADVDVEYALDGDVAAVDATVSVRNVGDRTEHDLSLALAGESVTRTVDCPPGESETTLSLECDGIDRWELDDPTLYDIAVGLATAESGVTVSAASGQTDDAIADLTDDYRDRIGFREITIEGREILLNGDPVELLGVNRHEDHPEWGHAQPLRVMQLDIDRIQDAGINVIRGGHYPNHPRFLDLCDERGVLFIEEIPFWQYDTADFEREPVLERGTKMLEETVTRDRHHPSVLAWSVTNECANEEPGVEAATKELLETARSLDDRPVTLASNNDAAGQEDRCLQHCDFACINAYRGWYSGGNDHETDWADFFHHLAETYPDVPVVLSEFGAGAIYGERTWASQKWSEPYQADLLETVISTLRDHDAMTGFTIWQYCDIRTSRNAMTRPKSKNNKGIVDEYRRPKDAYWQVKSTLTGSADE